MTVSELRHSARRRLAGAWLAVLGLTFAASAADAAPADPQPPTCAGRDLSRDPAADPKAVERAAAARPGELDNARGLLWRIDKPGLAPSYLFATIHSTDDRAVAIARQAAAHIDGAKVVATELGGPFDKATLTALGMTMALKAMARETDTLTSLGSSEDIAIVEKYLAGRGLSADFAHHLRAWFLAALASAPPCEVQRQQADLPIVDEVIARAGEDRGLKVVGLETISEQTDVLSSIDPKLAAMVLISAARQPDVTEDAYATMVSLYVQGEPAQIMPVLDASLRLAPEAVKAENEFARHLLGGRNAVMVERMQPLLNAGGAFVAVGALHLVGKGGLIELLRERGFAVTKTQ